MSPRFTPAIACACVTALTGSAMLACSGSDESPGATSSSSSSSSSSGAGGGTAGATFKPQSCSFEIAARPEYTAWSSGKTDVGASPSIRRVRRGLGGNVAPGSAGHADPATTAAFGWQTDDGTLASELTWGSSPDPKSWPAANRTSGVTWLTPPGTINGAGPARMHEAYVCGLTPATTYYYRAGGGPAGGEVWSDVLSFTTTPSDPSASVTLAITGDSRGEQNDAWSLLQKKLSSLSPTLALFNGDAITLGEDQGGWEKWLDHAAKDGGGKYLTLGSLLTLTAHGNHDAHTALFFGNMVLPQDVGAFPKYAELFYSVDVGPAHVIVVDDAWIGSPSLDPDYAKVLGDWLEADLTAADKNRANVPWILVTHHHAEYSSSDHGTDADVLKDRAFFAPIWDKHHVDLAVVSHDHDYERSKPLTGSGPTTHANFADGTVYVVCAGAGADAYAPGTSPFTEMSHGFGDAAGGAIGLYSVVTLTKSSLKLDAHELRADGSDPVIDTFTISK